MASKMQYQFLTTVSKHNEDNQCEVKSFDIFKVVKALKTGNVLKIELINANSPAIRKKTFIRRTTSKYWHMT